MMKMFRLLTCGLVTVAIIAILAVFHGCRQHTEMVDKQGVLEFDTADAQSTFHVLSKYPKPMADSLYRTLFLELSRQQKYSLLERHLAEYRKIDTGSVVIRSMVNLYKGLIVLKRFEYDSATSFVDQALKVITEKDFPNEFLVALRTKAICYNAKGTYDRALGLRYQMLRLCEKNNDTLGKYQEMGELGITFFMAHHYEKAKVLIDSSLNYFVRTRNEPLEAYFLSSKSVILFSFKQFDSAIVTAKRSLELRIKFRDFDGQAESYNNLALAYMGKGEWETAKGYLEQALHIYKQLQNERQIPIILQNIATCYDRLGMPDSALSNIEESYLLAQRKGQLEEEKVGLRMLAKFYMAKKDYKKTFEYYRLFNVLKDSLFSLEKQKAIEELSMKYETAKKEERIKLLEKDRQIQWQNKWMLAGLLIASVIVGGVIMLMLSFRNRKNKELFRSKEKLRLTELAQVKNELDFNKKELESFMLNFIEKTKLISDLERNLASFSEMCEMRNPAIDQDISELFKMKILTEENWSQFKGHFEKAYPGLIQQVKMTYQNLSPAELRLFLLMKLNVDSKEIASILGISVDSVKKSRYRLKKKMDLKEEDDLVEFVRNY